MTAEMCRRLSLLFASGLMFKDRVLSDVSPTVVCMVPNAARVPAVTDPVERFFIVDSRSLRW